MQSDSNEESSEEIIDPLERPPEDMIKGPPILPARATGIIPYCIKCANRYMLPHAVQPQTGTCRICSTTGPCGKASATLIRTKMDQFNKGELPIVRPTKTPIQKPKPEQRKVRSRRPDNVYIVIADDQVRCEQLTMTEFTKLLEFDLETKEVELFKRFNIKRFAKVGGPLEKGSCLVFAGKPMLPKFKMVVEL